MLTAPNYLKDFLDLWDDYGQSGLTLQLFPIVILVNQVWCYMETIVTSNLIGQNNLVNQWKCFMQLGAGRYVTHYLRLFFWRK